MPEVKIQLPETPNNEWQDKFWKFDGQWMPDIDPALIGPQNYATLKNLRYKDQGLEGIAGYSAINSTALVTYTQIRNGHQLRTNKTQTSYTLVHAINPADTQGRVYVNRTAIGSTGDFDGSSKFDTSGNAYFADANTGLTGRFSDAPQGNIAYCNAEESMIFGGDEQRIAAVFTTDNDVVTDRSIAYPEDITDKMNSELSTSDQRITYNSADQEFLVIMTTRPIQSIKYYVHTANEIAATQTVKYWDGTAWSADQVDTDGTIGVAGKTLSQTGVVTLTSHTDGSVKLFHFEELFLYTYLVEISAGSAVLYHITVDFAFQTVKDVWDGVYRQPIQYQYSDAGVYEDYTLQVNESSDVNTPIVADLDDLAHAADDVFVMFEEQMAAIRIQML
ncbi:MAG: hypothetical protein ACXABY_08505, partial [Candidatus Thorarchaeota archaeon]